MFRSAKADSDHFFAVTRIRARISVVKRFRLTRQRKYDLGKLKDPDLRMRFSTITDESKNAKWLKELYDLKTNM